MDSIGNDIRDLEDRMKKTLSQFKRGPRKRILRKATRIVVLSARRTKAFRNRTGVLRKSLNRVPGLRKSNDEFVGPLSGKSRKYDGYYAAMVLGSSIAFRRGVLDPAARNSRREVFATVEKEAQEEIKKLAAKNKLD